MDSMLATSLLSLVLFGLAGILLDAHRRDWRVATDLPRDEAAYRFARGRVIRRRVASGGIAVVAGFVAVWPITPREPFWVVLYTALVLLMAIAIFALGVSDAWASGRFYRAESRRRLTKQTAVIREALRNSSQSTASASSHEANRV